MFPSQSEILILGLYVIDEIISKKDKNNNLIGKEKAFLSLGGPPTFMGFVGNILSHLFSEINKPTLYSYMCPVVERLLESTPEVFNLSGYFIQHSICPKFRLDYSHTEQERKITLFDPLNSFDLKFFPWKLGESTIVIVGSVYQEFNNSSIFQFLHTNGFYVVLDPQGFFRKLSPDGKVSYSNWFNRDILSQIDCVKLSENEAKLLDIGVTLPEIVENLLLLNISYVIITKGERGSILGCKEFHGSQHVLFSIPAYTVDSVIDETGAGDTFIYTFIVFFQLLSDVLEAIAFASSVASLLVENRFDDTVFTIENIVIRQERIRAQIKLLDIDF
ncbi:MAG: hypothetical protein KAT16_07450 [Candidatus Heimdallarchaeota archaeon]|nr:hypothetical protein [Candidatus Heimdallarchaeota archaeon]